MKNFLVTYIPNTTDFMTELKQVAPHLLKIEDGDIVGWKIEHTTKKVSQNGTLSMSILSGENLEIVNNMISIQVLGTYSDIQNDTDKLAIYKSVYDYTIPDEIIDENGDVIKQDKPFEIGNVYLGNKGV